MGYETPDMTQGYPFSYMSNAQAIGLLDDVNMVASTDALRGEDAQVIYNALFADYARGAMLVNTTHGTSVESYPTLAQHVWGLETAAVGTWNGKDDEEATLTNCKAHTWVVIGAAQDEENAILAYPIDDDTTDLYKSDDKNKEYAPYKFKYEGAGDVESIKGYRVELWGEGSHGEPVWEKGEDDGKFVYSDDWTIKAIKTEKGQTKYDYNASMADSKDDNGTIVLDDDTSLKLETVADNAENVESSDEVLTLDTFLADSLNSVSIGNDKSVEKALNVRNGAQYQLMDWDGDKDIDWVVVDEARYYKVDSVSSKRMTVVGMQKNSNLLSASDEQVETWKLDENEKIGTNDAKKDVKIKYEVPDGIEEGDIIEVTYKVTYEGKAQLITATVSVVDAENKSFDEVGTRDGLTLIFDDEEIKVAQNADFGDVIVPENPQKYKDFNGEELGTEFALWMNRNGFIVYSDYATESSNYMMVLNTYGGSNSTGNRDLAVIDIMTSDNQEKNDVKVASDARVLAKDGTDMGAYSSRTFDESKVVGNVFKYWTDEDGVITKMQAVFDDQAKATTSNATADTYEYDADADRLVDTDGSTNNYVASLEDADVIFAVKGNYIRTGTDTVGNNVKGDNIEVKAADVLAVKQSDIPDIGTDPVDQPLLGNRLTSENTWLGTDAANNDAFVVDLDKNSEAKAAILGVSNFNKFNAGATKLGLVTNVSERTGGTIKVTAAVGGEVKTLSTVEKSDFDDVVKVFDGTDDISVSGVDATINAANNGIFNGYKLSEVVNQGGQYAEITTDADGNLTKVTFLDDETTNKNDNYLKGHYYDVSRNLVLNVSDKNLKYALNDSQTYTNVYAAQYFASDENLYSVGRLVADTAGYASDAKFYAIDATPSRHNVDYAGTRLTVNAGFDNLRDSDITAIEKGDVAYYEPNQNADKNIYEVADIAFSNDDIVAVYSFKNLDEQTATDIAVVSAWNADGTVDTDFEAGETINLRLNVVDSDSTKTLNNVKVYKNGIDVTADFKPTITKGYGTRLMEATITIPENASGEYTIKGAGANATNGVFDGGMTIDVTASTKKFEIAQIQFTDINAANPDQDVNPMTDNKSFGIYVTGNAVTRAASPVTTLTANDLTVKLGAIAQPFTLMNKGNGYYIITLTGTNVDLTQSPYKDAGLTVELTPASNSNVVAPSAGLKPLVDTDIPNKNNDAAGTGVPNNSSSVSTVTGVDNVASLTIDPDQFAGGSIAVTKVTVKALTSDGTTVVKDLKTGDFSATVGGSAKTFTMTDNKDGTYELDFSGSVTDLRGSTVVITVNGRSANVTVPAATVSITPTEKTLDATYLTEASDNTTLTLKNTSGVKVAKTAAELSSATESVTLDNGVTVTVTDSNVTLAGTPNAAGQVKFYIGNADAQVEMTLDVAKKKITTLTPATVTAPTSAGLTSDATVPTLTFTDAGYGTLVVATADGAGKWVETDVAGVDGTWEATDKATATYTLTLSNGDNYEFDSSVTVTTTNMNSPDSATVSGTALTIVYTLA